MPQWYNTRLWRVGLLDSLNQQNTFVLNQPAYFSNQHM